MVLDDEAEGGDGRNPAIGVPVGVMHELILSGNEGTMAVRSMAIGGERCSSERGLFLF
jgi:hypothetical protein